MKKLFFFLIIVPFFLNLRAQSYLNGDNSVCTNAVLNYTVSGQIASCGSIIYTVTGGVFPDHADATTITLTAPLSPISINVKWTGAAGGSGSISATGCSSTYTASKNVTFPPVPNVSHVQPFSAIPCGSTSVS